MKTRKSNTLSHTLSAIALMLTTFIAGTAGAAVLKADFNRDGFEDLVVGSPYEDVGSIQNAGAISVFYGTASGLPRSPNRQWYQGNSGINGAAEAYDQFGSAVAVGDFNRDGYDDVAIGVPFEDVGGVGPDGKGTDAGVVNVIYGSVSGLQAQGNQMLSLATVGYGFTQSDAYFGNALTAGDFNGDGFEDLAVGVRGWDEGDAYNAGRVGVFFGGIGGFSSTRTTAIGQSGTFQLESFSPWDQFGFTLATADFDRDGYADLAIGVPYENVDVAQTVRKDDAGMVHVLYGASTGFGTATRSLTLIDSGSNASVETGDLFGWSLTAGDFNGDSYPDLVVGAPYEDDGASDAGAVTIIFGSRFGLISGSRDYWPANRSGLPDKAETSDKFGWSLTAADFTGDGIADLVIGVPYEKQERTLQFDRPSAGQVTVLYGSRTGMIVNARSYWHEDQPNVPGSRAENDRFGWALSVGDFNGDNRADLVVGVPGESVYASQEGSADIFYGAPGGLSADAALGPQLISEIIGNQEAGDQFGSALP